MRAAVFKDWGMNEPKNVSFLGLGVMGGAIARHIARAGHRLTIYNRSPERARRWQEAKRLLNEEAKRTAKLLLNRTDLKPAGVELPYKLKPSIGATSNFVAAFQMVNEAVTKRVANGKKKRQEWTTEEFEAAMKLLPEVLDALVREIKKLQNAKG